MNRRTPIPPFSSRRERFDRVRVASTSDRGLGVFATAPLKAGRAIGRIRGELKPTEFRSEYCVGFGDVALEPEAPYRFLNHSCDPNCEFIEWDFDANSFDGSDPIEPSPTEPLAELWLHALRDVAVGEELTIDYGWDWRAAIPCRCGAPNCRGWICKEDELEICRRERGDAPKPDAENRRQSADF